MASEVHARHNYAPDDLRFGEVFVDITFDGSGQPEELDIDRIDETKPVGEV
jgi:hypothetical protein